MLTQYGRKITQSELRNAAFFIRFVIPSLHTKNNTYQDINNLNHRTCRIKKLKLPEIRTKNYTQTHTQTGFTAPYKNRAILRKNAQSGTVSRTQNKQ